MRRYIGWLALLGTIAVPAWAAACWPQWRQPVYPMYAPPPVYTSPIGPPVCVCPGYPAPVYPLAGPVSPVRPAPQADAIPMMAPPIPLSPPVKSTPKVEPAPTGAKSDSAPSIPKTAEGKSRSDAVQPAAGKEVATPQKEPSPQPAKNQAESQPAKNQAEPQPGKKTPVTPMVDLLPNGLPPLELPKEMEPPKKTAPAAKPSPAPAPMDLLPPGAPSKDPGPSPASPGASAIPSAAPADPLLPPLLVPGAKPEQLPSVTLPPESPVKPEGSTSRSSPVADATDVKVSRFPVASSEAIGGYRTVSFFNHTAHDLELTIEGRAVKLPAKNYLETKLGPTFTWSCGDRPACRERVPDGVAGLDVVFKEKE